MNRIAPAIAIAAGLVLAIAPAAHAYGPATHSQLGREAAKRLARDPRYAFLADDGYAATFRYGSIFPDVRQAESAAAGFAALKQKLEAMKPVKSVGISTVDVKPLDFDTHDRAFLRLLLERSEQWGDTAFRAFALGNVAHVIEDIHEQTIAEPCAMARTGAGDVGIRPIESASALATWGPGSEVDDLFDALVDWARARDEARPMRDLPRSLVRSGSVFTRLTRSMQRLAEIKHLYWLVAKEYHDVKLARSGFITELGFQNTTRLYEAALTLFPYGIGAESASDAAKAFKSRYVSLHWWADLASFIVNAIVRVFTIGQMDAYDLIAAFVHPERKVAAALSGADPIFDIVFGFTHGGDAERAVRQRLANDVEFQRLLASGLLEKTSYSAIALDDAVAMAVDAIERRSASRWFDETQWAVWDPKGMQAGAIGGLAGLMGRGSGYAAEPGLIVSRARIIDPATGATVTALKYPGDVGRPLRVEIELFAPFVDPLAAAGRDVALAVRSDSSLGRSDPLVARVSTRLPFAVLTTPLYGRTAKPKIALDLVAPADVGQQGLYVELDAGRGVFFTTNTAAFAPLTRGRPQYAQFYAPYGAYPPAVKITR